MQPTPSPVASASSNRSSASSAMISLSSSSSSTSPTLATPPRAQRSLTLPLPVAPFPARRSRQSLPRRRLLPFAPDRAPPRLWTIVMPSPGNRRRLQSVLPCARRKLTLLRATKAGPPTREHSVIPSPSLSPPLTTCDHRQSRSRGCYCLLAGVPSSSLPISARASTGGKEQLVEGSCFLRFVPEVGEGCAMGAWTFRQ